MPLPEKVSESVRRLNPGIYGQTAATQISPVSSPRLRQNRGPKMNKLEQAFYEKLKFDYPDSDVRAHGFKLQLANGVTYLPDFVVIHSETSPWECYEVKGKHAWDDAIVKLKIAAALWKSIRFFLVSRDGRTGPWRIERVWP